MSPGRRGYGLAVACVFALPNPVSGQRFEVPSGPLGQVAALLGKQASATITVAEPELAIRRSDGVRGAMPLRKALDRALRGTGAEAVFYDPTTIRIVRSKAPLRKPSVRPPVVRDFVEEPPEDIVVVASKQRRRLADYPGSVKIIEARGDWAARNGADGMAALTRIEPTVQSTDLGQGRDKLFVRGIADSSFRGQTQATTGQYFGDVRLTYNAPDPSLSLYDVDRVEVLIGPQAPLYGAGSLGGVIRIVPHAPDFKRGAASVSSNLGFTRYGGISHDAAVMLNVPLVADRAAIRVVAYGGRRSGYIDAPVQDRSNINAVRSSGYRGTVGINDIHGWDLEIGAVQEELRSRDGQYTLRDAPALTRDAPIPQPFESNYRLRYVTARRDVGSTRIVSTTANVRHNLSTVFDASALFGPAARYEERNDIGIWSHETRWSGGSLRTPWLMGVSGILNSSRSDDAIIYENGRAEVGFLNRNFETALFGQYSHALGTDLALIAGGRLGYTQTEGVVVTLESASTRFRRESLRFSPTIALNWTPPGRLSGFFRHDQGYRAGGLAVFPTGDGSRSRSYRPDTLDMYEVGLRLGVEGRDPLVLRTSVFLTDWANVQADLVTLLGFTFTANVGRGRIKGIDSELTWEATDGLSLKADLFLNDSRLNPVEGDLALTSRRRLPNVASAGGRIGMTAQTVTADGTKIRGDAAIRYVGRSWLGAGLALDIPQGGYITSDLGCSFELGRTTLSLRVDNLTDTRGNTFSFGNPFTVLKQDQTTPLRPRTIKLGFDVRL